jgi:hypothetical protein
MAAKLSVVVIGDAASAKAAMAETGAAAEGMSGKVGKAGSSIAGSLGGLVKSVAPLAIALGAADFAKGAIGGAEKLKKANDSLAVAIQHTHGNLKVLQPQYEATASAAAKYGMTQVDAMQGLAKATLLTGSAKSAQAAYNEALVISKATGKDFGAVLTATSKAQDGNTGALGRYGILLKKGSDGQEQLNDVMKRFGGQAQANTSATDQLHSNFSNLMTTVGTALLPIFDKLVGALDGLIQHLSPVVSQISGAVIPVFQTLYGFFNDNILPVLGQLRTIFVNAVQKIGGVVQAHMPEIHTIFSNLSKVIENIGKIVMPILKVAFDTILPAALSVAIPVLKIITGILANVSTALSDIIGWGIKVANWLANLPGKLSSVFGTLGHDLAGAFKAPLDMVISAWNAIGFDLTLPKIHIPFVGDIGGEHISWHVPQLPMLETGGLVMQTGLAVVHRGEMFSGTQNQMGFGGVTVNVTVNGSADPAFARMLSEQLAVQLRGGRAPALASAIGSL